MEPESPGTEKAKVRTRVTRIRSVPVGNRVPCPIDARWEKRHKVQTKTKGGVD